jgi:hypothetical protein
MKTKPWRLPKEYIVRFLMEKGFGTPKYNKNWCARRLNPERFRVYAFRQKCYYVFDIMRVKPWVIVIIKERRHHVTPYVLGAYLTGKILPPSMKVYVQQHVAAHYPPRPHPGKIAP